MNFLNPLVLFGLAAGAIPILIHLLNLQRKKKIEFSSLKFLKQLQDNKIRKLKIRQWLLLLIRTLIILSLVFAFARPTIESQIPGLVSYSKTNAAIVIDNSFSTNISDQYGNRFRRSKTIANDIIEKLETGDMAEVLQITELNNFNNSLKQDLTSLNNKITNLDIGITKPQLASNIETAANLFADNPNLNSEIFIISDGQKNIFEIEDSINNIDFQGSLKFIKIGSQIEGQNLSIDSINIISSIFQFGKVVEYLVHITNHSSSKVSSNILSLSYNKERVAQISFDVDQAESIAIKIAAPVNFSGLVKGELKLEEDIMSEDNQFNFGFKIPDKIRVASFSKTKNSFLNIALNSTPNDINIFSENDLPSQDLSQFDVIYLSNGNFKQQDFNRIKQYLKDGGSVMLFDSRISEVPQNQFLKEIGFESIKFINAESPAKFSNVEKIHPIFEGVFKTSDKNKIIESPEINLLNVAVGGNSLIETDYGSFLSEINFGDGKLLYCSVSPDMEASNLPVNGIFPTLLVRSQYYLTASSESGVISSVSGKIVVKIKSNDSPTDNFKIIDPNQNEFFVKAATLPSGSVLILDEIDMPGYYEVYNSDNKAVAIVSVNHDSNESISEYLNESDIIDKLKSIMPNNTKIEYYDDPKEIKNEMVRASLGTELWKLFVLLAIAFALLEIFVQKIYKSEIS
ncbi:BatA domain-containing protein [Candidatus Kapabacteria bacterium]|nr:BatA domain-containing protein [Candidatus Kapabacteria bacterium]